jgi:hypothetical protein
MKNIKEWPFGTVSISYGSLRYYKKRGQGSCPNPTIYSLLFTGLRCNVFFVFPKYIDKEANI